MNRDEKRSGENQIELHIFLYKITIKKIKNFIKKKMVDSGNCILNNL